MKFWRYWECNIAWYVHVPTIDCCKRINRIVITNEIESHISRNILFPLVLKYLIFSSSQVGEWSKAPDLSPGTRTCCGFEPHTWHTIFLVNIFDWFPNWFVRVLICQTIAYRIKSQIMQLISMSNKYFVLKKFTSKLVQKVNFIHKM